MSIPFNDALARQKIAANLATGSSITASELREPLNDILDAQRDSLAAYVTHFNTLSTSLISRSLNSVATIFVRGDTGLDTRTGEQDNNTASGTVRTLARVLALHSGKTQKLTVNIESGLVEVVADLIAQIPELVIVVRFGATLKFTKRTLVKDSANVTVGEGTFRLLCFSNSVTLSIAGYLEIIDHTGSSGNGDQFFYRTAQGAIAICSDANGVEGIAFQTIAVWQTGNIYIGNNALLFCYGNQGTNFYGSPLARYRRLSGGGSLTLGTNAVESLLETDKLRETLVFEGTVAAKSFIIRRAYAFTYALLHNDGCTITVQPAANCAANTDHTLTFTGTAGKTVTVRLISNI